MRANQVWIFGASQGLGLAMAHRLHGQGRTVTGFARRRIEGGPFARTLQVDVSDPDSLDAAVAGLLRQAPTPDLVVFAAGFTSQGSLVSRSEAAMREELEVNYLGFVRLCQALATHKPDRAKLRLVAIGSTVGYVGCPSLDTYSAAKAALFSFARSARAELGDMGIDILILSPPHMNPSTAVLLGPAVFPVDWAAERLLKAMAQGRREHTLGASNRFIIGLARLAPGLAQAMMNSVGMRSLTAVQVRG